MSEILPWWERYPGLCAAEEASLERLGGVPPELNAELLEQQGSREYSMLYVADDSTEYSLRVRYSDFHPWFQVEVYSDTAFAHHQSPFGGPICLLRGGTAAWDVSQTAGDFIAEQFPKFLADQGQQEGGQDEDRPSGPEVAVSAGDPHVEPRVKYYGYNQPAAVRVDGAWAALDAEAGTLLIGLDGDSTPESLRGTVLKVTAADGTVLASAASEIDALYPPERRIRARWCRLPSPPTVDGGEGLLAAAVEGHPALRQPDYQDVNQGASVDVIAALFPDDVRGDINEAAVERGDSWAFVVRVRQHNKAKQPKHTGRVTPRSRPFAYLARGFRAGRVDMTERVPSLRPLRSKTVALFGAGGLGAPSAIEFAKAGLGTLHITEPDVLEPGNACRWPLGFSAAGHAKADLLCGLIRLQWPHTSVHRKGHRIGHPRHLKDELSHLAALGEMVADADLIYDATAEKGVNYFLSELAASRGIPYIVVSATEGGWGGMAARFWPGPEAACWTCLMHHFDDQSDDSLTEPPRDPNPATKSVWPAGCTDPTFTGTGFDIAAVANTGVRLAVSTLCVGKGDGYPPIKEDYLRLELRSQDTALPGATKGFQITPHPDCERCKTRRSG